MTFLATTVANLLMAIGAALGFELSFKFTGLLDGYFGYAQGISLLFLPAGVKLLFIMVGRIPALVGLTVMAAYAAVGEWTEQPVWMPVSFAIVAQLNYYLAVYVVLRLLEIDERLTNLRYWHIVALSLAVSLVNGVIHNIVYLAEGVSVAEDFFRRSAAMTFGDFMGCFVVLSLFHVAISQVKPLKVKDQF